MHNDFGSKRLPIMDDVLDNPEAIKAGDANVHGMRGIVLAALFAGVAYVGYHLATTAFHLFSLLGRTIHDNWILGEIGAVATVAVGTVLYLVREIKRFWYALAELVFAALTGGFAISRVGSQVGSQGDLGAWVALGASSYLVVRGLDNLKQSGVDVAARCRPFIDKIGARAQRV